MQSNPSPNPVPGRRARSLLARATFAALILVAPLVSIARAGGGDERINVLFVICDQLNAHALGCYGNGFGGLSQSITPRLDELASEGVRFENAFCASPQCCPSRYSIFTGRWPHSHGLRWNDVWEPRGELVLPRLARAAGYATATIGKHHMMWLDQPEPRAEDLGFDLVLDMVDYAQFCTQHQRPRWDERGNYWGVAASARLQKVGYSFSPNAFHPEGYFPDRAIEFLEARAADGRPFVCWLAPTGPHTPVLPSGPATPEDWAHMHQPFETLDLPPNAHKRATTERLRHSQAPYAQITDDEWREALSYYYGLVSQMDANIGRVLDRLDELGLSEHTLVVFTADHGAMATEMGTWTKGTGSYEAIARVPLIARLPGVLPAGRNVRELVSQLDLFPTFLELLGLPIEDADRARLEGTSFLDLALGRGTWRDEVFVEFGSEEVPQLRTRMVRTLDAKYAYDEWSGGDEEIYELVRDPYECSDLFRPELSPRVLELRERLEAWWNGELGHAPEYRVSGGPGSRPCVTSDPIPRDAQAAVPRDVDLHWLPSTAAETQYVRLGTSPDALALFRVLGPMESSCNVGTLAPNTPYYWRVDGENGNGQRVGPVWSFTTGASPSGPGLASAPTPATSASGVALEPTLAWHPASDAERQLLWFGPQGALAFVGNFAASTSSYALPRLEGGRVYEWRVDSADASGTTRGDLWRFTTDASGLADLASEPSPAHLDEAVPLGALARFAWSAGGGALEHELYFGTEFPLDFLGRTDAPNFVLPQLEQGRTYYWRVDEKNAAGTRRGSTWRFTVAP